MSVSASRRLRAPRTAMVPPIANRGMAQASQNANASTPPVCGSWVRFATFLTWTVLLSSLLVRFGTVPVPLYWMLVPASSMVTVNVGFA